MHDCSSSERRYFFQRDTAIIMPRWVLMTGFIRVPLVCALLPIEK